MDQLLTVGWEDPKRGCPLLRPEYQILELQCYCQPSGTPHRVRTTPESGCLRSADFLQLICPCNAESIFSCALVNPLPTYKILLITEDALMTGFAKIELVSSSDRGVYHFLSILRADIWPWKNPIRNAGEISKAEISGCSPDHILGANSVVLKPNWDKWEVLKVNQPISTSGLHPGNTLPQLRLKKLYQLMCFCGDPHRDPSNRFGHPKHDFDALDYIYLPCTEPGRRPLEECLVVVVEQGLACFDALELRRCEIVKTDCVPDLGNYSIAWHELRVKFVKVFDCDTVDLRFSMDMGLLMDEKSLAFSGKDWNKFFGHPWSWDFYSQRWYNC